MSLGLTLTGVTALSIYKCVHFSHQYPVSVQFMLNKRHSKEARLQKPFMQQGLNNTEKEIGET